MIAGMRCVMNGTEALKVKTQHFTENSTENMTLVKTQQH